MTHVAMTVEQCWEKVPGGSATYLLALLRALAARGDVRTTGIAARHGAPPDADLVPPGPVAHSSLPRYLLYRSWNHLARPRAEQLVPDADLVHATTWAIPATRRPLVVTVHDVAFLREPEHFTPRGVRFFTTALARTAAEASAVVVPSAATAADCIAAGIEAARLHVVPHGAPSWAVTTEDVAQARHRLGLPSRYVLWSGTTEPRKNLGGLLAAFALLAQDDPETHLVLVGPRGWGEVTHTPAPGPWRTRVHELGRLPWADLPPVYAGAAAFAFPSHWEGFGLPVLEAMSVGTPVVTSRDTSMAEVVADAGVLVDPRDPAAIAAGLRRALDERAVLGPAGRARAARYTWQASGIGHVEAYSAALRAHGDSGPSRY